MLKGRYAAQAELNRALVMLRENAMKKPGPEEPGFHVV